MPDVPTKQTKILVGTASWQEPDFIKYWYPPTLPKTKLLPYYAEHFSFVEVNGSFYGIPQPKVTEQWCRQTPDNFVFSLKLHRLLSRHATEAKFLPPDIRPKADIVNGKVELSAKMEKLVAKKYIAGLEPILNAGKLGALLLQLSPSFRPHSNQLTELDHVIGLFSDFSLAVELRNRFWLEGDQTDRTVGFFKERNVTLASVDAPESNHFTVMPNVDYITNPRLAYIRLHGRNEEAYVKGRTVQERFDYDYNEEELLQFAGRVTGLAEKTEAVQIVFNNNRHRYAPDAAERLMKKLAETEKGLSVARPFKSQLELT